MVLFYDPDPPQSDTLGERTERIRYEIVAQNAAKSKTQAWIAKPDATPSFTVIPTRANPAVHPSSKVPRLPIALTGKAFDRAAPVDPMITSERVN